MTWEIVKPPLDKVIRSRIDAGEKEAFERWCKKNNTTPSDEIRKFIKNVIQIGN